jgi:hypothetical protein
MGGGYLPIPHFSSDRQSQDSSKISHRPSDQRMSLNLERVGGMGSEFKRRKNYSEIVESKAQISKRHPAGNLLASQYNPNNIAHNLALKRSKINKSVFY